MICQLYDLWYRENRINMLSDQNTAMNWNLSPITACISVPWCKIKVLKHWKSYKDAYILQESFVTTDKSYPTPCRNYLQLLYLSVTLYACAQRGHEHLASEDAIGCIRDGKSKNVTARFPNTGEHVSIRKHWEWQNVSFVDVPSEQR